MTKNTNPPSPQTPGADYAAEDAVSQALAQFRPIQNRWLFWLARLLPGVIILELALVPLDLMYRTAMVTVVLLLVIMQVFLKQLPETFARLWSRNVKPGRTAVLQGSDAGLGSASAKAREKQFLAFLNGLENWLNHRLQWLSGLTAVLIGLLRFPPTMVIYGYSNLGDYLSSRSSSGWVTIALEILTSFIVGLIAWRVLISSLHIWRISRSLPITPQLGHLDNCGGLAPMGDLCLWNALLLVLPAIFLGGWINLGNRYANWASEYVSVMTFWFWILLVVAIFVFFLPLWGIHQSMAATKKSVQQRLDLISEEIDRLSRELLFQTDHIPTEISDQKLNRLKLMQNILAQHQSIPVWPINLVILAKLATYLITPLFSYLGLDQLVEFIPGIRDLLQAMAQGQ